MVENFRHLNLNEESNDVAFDTLHPGNTDG